MAMLRDRRPPTAQSDEDCGWQDLAGFPQQCRGKLVSRSPEIVATPIEKFAAYVEREIPCTP
jgi:hypothetical protein